MEIIKRLQLLFFFAIFFTHGVLAMTTPALRSAKNSLEGEASGPLSTKGNTSTVWPSNTKGYTSMLWPRNTKAYTSTIWPRNTKAYTSTVWPSSTRERYNTFWSSSNRSNAISFGSPTTPYPCLYGNCNGTCCKADSLEAFFDCANGQKINKSLVCNRVNDCKDGSDESVCAPWAPKITVLPKEKVELYCGDQDEKNSGKLILECESVGHPAPTIRWRKYEGHVPSKCQQYSKRGHGILTCPNFRQSDQGAYSCVAENSVKSAESQPKSIAKCSNTIHCKGFRVVNKEQIEHCLECYCSGKTTECQNIKSNSTVIKIPFPEDMVEVFAKDTGEIAFIPTKTELSPDAKSRQSTQEVTYCSLSKTDFEQTSFLKSFGRSIIIPRFKGKADFLEKAPDLIIQGNDLSLMYTANLLSHPSNSAMKMSVRFWPGNWHHLNKKPATRKDLMKVLSNVDSLLLRCEYQQGKTFNVDKNSILLESSIITDHTTSPSYVEKCNCPLGYDGLSCETCAVGYAKKSQGNDFICQKIYVPPPSCKEGYTGLNCSDCDTLKGYRKRGGVCEKPSCHPDGSTSYPGFFDKCTCKEGVTGDSCDRCKNDSFYLHKARGCLKCWCSGVTNQCKSSSLYRTVISSIPRGGYNSSDGRNFWLLPSEFNGNRLTSYGGYFNYTMKYQPHTPKENSYLTVEFLSKDDVTLIYTHPELDRSSLKIKKSWSVPITEINWRKSDRTFVTREEFLTVLSKIKAIYIESPYHISSGASNLTSILMSSATASGFDLALEVEQCSCPLGYTGLSCESCSEGYYKKRNGTVMECIKCNCAYCDPDFGCPDCPQLTYRDNPEKEKIPVCKPCNCNGNGVSCIKDDYGQIFCRCKPGFTGMHCENTIPSENDFLTVTISPRTIKGRKLGTRVSVNCSFSSSEEMMLLVTKTVSTKAENILTTRGSKISKNIEVALESGLEAIDCFVYDIKNRVVGHVASVVEDLITTVKPVKITNCYSDKIDVKESESKEIICEATGSPMPNVTWYRSRNGSTAEKVDTTKGVHTIRSASLSDNGTVYSCIAENAEEKATCAAVLIVTEKCEIIHIVPKHVKVVEGKNITIQCKTTANTSVFWTKLDSINGREQSLSLFRTKVQDSTLHILNAEVSDSGTYVCSATGKNGKINNTVEVVVEEKRVFPTVRISEYDKTLNVGENFEVSCTTTGKPTPSVGWTKTNDSLKSNVIVSGNTLKINKAVLENSGFYKCTAKSISGEAFGYIQIDVKIPAIPPTVIISTENITPYAGEKVMVECLATGFPRPQLSWHLPNVNFSLFSRQNDSVVSIEPRESVKEEITFTIPEGNDELTVTCLADNEGGKGVAKTKIKVLQAKDEINETVEFVPIGTNFELTCEFKGKLKWEKLNTGLVGDECPIPNSLRIPSVQVQHNGTYTCTSDAGSKKIINLSVIGFVPKFSKALNSYLVLSTKLKSAKEIRTEISFSPTKENGVLLKEESGMLNIYLKNREIHVGLSSDEENLFDIVMNKPLRLKSWYWMVVSLIRNQVDITIYDEKTSIFGRKTEVLPSPFNITIGDTFFVGGLSPSFRHLHRKFWQHFPHFDGCISRLSIDRHEFDIVKEGLHSLNVNLCNRCIQEPNLCAERGKCLDAPTQYGFVCLCPERLSSQSCPASCVGRGCETQFDLCDLLKPCSNFIHHCSNVMNRLTCTCASGYTGTSCEKVQLHSFCTTGNGYVRLPSNVLERTLDSNEVIRMSFTLSKPNGQLLWQGDTANYLSIEARDRKIHYVYFNQNSKLEINGGLEVELNKKYILSFQRDRKTVVMRLERMSDVVTKEVKSNSTSKFLTNRVFGDIYLGNVPNNTNIRHHVGLDGCIHYISFGQNAKINLPEVTLEGVNVILNSAAYNKNYNDSDDSENSNNDIVADDNYFEKE